MSDIIWDNPRDGALKNSLFRFSHYKPSVELEVRGTSSIETPNSHTHSYHLIVSKQTKHRASKTNPRHHNHGTNTGLIGSYTTLLKTWTSSKT